MKPVEDLPYIEWEGDFGLAQRIYADVVKREEIVLSAAVTEFAIEDGSKITDHYIAEPNVVRVEMFFSGSPVRGDLIGFTNPGLVAPKVVNLPTYPIPVSLQGGVQAIGGALGLGSGGPMVYEALQFLQQPDELRHAHEVILELRENGTLITVGTTLAVYPEMAIMNATITRDENSGDGGTITLDLKQLTFVSSDITLAIALPKEPRAQTRKASNKQVPQKEPEGPKKTAAAALADSITG